MKSSIMIDMSIINDSFDKVFKDKDRILVVMPHPDDTELYCGATVARLMNERKRVRVIKMTFGDKGCKREKISHKELKTIREKEDKEAMKILGIRDEDNIYFGIDDGAIEHNLPTIGKVVYQIRQFKPQLIITTNSEDMIIRFAKDVNWVNHRDHRNCARTAIDAAYPYARDLLFFPEQLKDKGLESHACTEFLLTDFFDHPDLIYIDITKYIDYRTKALACHSSQYSWQHARESTDFFTKLPQYGAKHFDRFRYVIAD